MSQQGENYLEDILRLSRDEKYFGRMNDPVSVAYFKGACGDAMEFYLVIADDKISDIKYYTQGCAQTRACAAMVARMAYGKTTKQALAISAGAVIAKIQGLTQEHRHCAILSVSTLYQALADYLLKL